MEIAPRPGHPAAHGGHPVPTAHHTQGCAGKGCWAGLRRAAPINKIPLQPPLCEAGACHPSSEVGCLPRQMARFLPRPPPPAQHRAGPPPLDPAGWRWEAPTGLRGVKLAVFLSPCPRGASNLRPQGPRLHIQPPHPSPCRSGCFPHLLTSGWLSVPFGGLRFFQQLSQLPPTKHSRRALLLCWDPKGVGA